MNMLTIISAVLISAISPITVPDLPGIKDARAIALEDAYIVAVIPDAYAGLDAKSDALRSAAESLGEEWGAEVILTEDLMTYMALSRIEKRGADDYERRNLAARLNRIRTFFYTAEKVG